MINVGDASETMSQPWSSWKAVSLLESSSDKDSASALKQNALSLSLHFLLPPRQTSTQLMHRVGCQVCANERSSPDQRGHSG